MKSKRTLVQQFKAARRAAVPIIAIETADPAQTIRTIGSAANGNSVLFEWDCSRSVTALNDAAEDPVKRLFGDEPSDRMLNYLNPSNFVQRLRVVAGDLVVPERSVVFMHMAHRFWRDEFVLQGIWNLRDWFKSRPAMLVLLCNIAMLPDELAQDVVVMQDPLPDRDEVKRIVQSVIEDASAEAPEDLDKILDMASGLAGYSVEQVVSLSFEKDPATDKVRLNPDILWDEKCNAIKQTDGLRVHEGPENFTSMGGCTNAKEFFIRLKTSPDRPAALMLIDEIEKQMSGATGPIGDSSGTSQDQLGVLLTTMQDYGISGWLEFGPPGASKTMFAKALANELEIPLILCDLGAMKGSLVGESERKIRAAMRVFLSVSNGRGMIIGTCNKFIQLPPELRRRFSNGMWFFDLPDSEEQEKIWPIYLNKYKLNDKPTFNYTGWTGAEIAKCCETAWRFNLSLDEASKFIVPVSKSSADVIEQMRQQASGKFISASKPGFYQRSGQSSGEQGQSRKITV